MAQQQTLTCVRCGSNRVMTFDAHARDTCYVTLDGDIHEGHAPHDVNLEGEDVGFTVCADCGQMFGTWPLEHHALADDDEPTNQGPTIQLNVLPPSPEYPRIPPVAHGIPPILELKPRIVTQHTPNIPKLSPGIPLQQNPVVPIISPLTTISIPKISPTFTIPTVPQVGLVIPKIQTIPIVPKPQTGPVIPTIPRPQTSPVIPTAPLPRTSPVIPTIHPAQTNLVIPKFPLPPIISHVVPIFPENLLRPIRPIIPEVVYKYTYPITRYSEVTTVIQKATHSEAEDDVMEFYQRDITDEDRERILSVYHTGGLDDVFEYIKDNLVERDPFRHPCKYFELMGDCQFYEGLDTIEENHYRVCLGS